MARVALIVNADDYAQDAAIDRAIVRLAQAGVVSATSAMVWSPRWPQARALLSGCDIDVGLHLDLTSPFAAARMPSLGDMGLGRLIARAHLRLLPQAQIRQIVDEQLGLFDAAMQRPPRFVDGHQHVHHLPVVRHALLAALADRYGRDAARIALRDCRPRVARGLKARVVAATGAAGLARMAQARGLSMNSDFAGVYGFEADANLPLLWRNWLSGLKGPQALMMCHVADGSDPQALPDPIHAARRREYAWLASAEWRALCAELGVQITRWSSAVSG